MREKYESLSVAVLKDLAKSRGIKNVSSMKKSEVVEAMLAKDEEEKAAAASKSAEEKPEKAKASESPKARPKKKPAGETGNTESHEAEGTCKEDEKDLDSGQQADGILEVMPDGYGFIRCENYLPGENDVYVSPSQIRKFNLKTGDIIVGNTRIKTQSEKFSALLYIKTINGFPPGDALRRPNFENLTPIFPNERIKLAVPGASVAMRIVDLVSPVGKGQRGMIVSPPKAGKTTLLKEVAKVVSQTKPEMHLIILLIDERPEEVTDIRESIEGKNVEVIYSTFDELPEHHKRVSEMVIERAKRLVEHGKDVMILLDSITRLARAYNMTITASGRTLSGGLDPAALHMPKKFFGAARNMREGGSLTILATALVDTGSKMDDVVYEEFKGTGNMELVLDRKLSEKRIFPALDITKSGTRREDLLMNEEELEAVFHMRKAINGMKTDDAVDNILRHFVRTKNNTEFIQTIKKVRLL
ncbi:MAG: transcription termination factor Rho [Lachnospiraceae bacterium]|nr:transcription termination factor Rho [Lachnospiraceae bacterium]